MFGFLFGFGIGLFLSCFAWLIIGLANPQMAVPRERAGRHHVLIRYALLLPFASFVIFLSSITWLTTYGWGGFGQGFLGWLAGLGAVAVAVPIERRWRRWRRARAERRRQAVLDAEARRARAVLERKEREAGVVVLNPARPPVDADEVVLELCKAKQRVLDAKRPDLAMQADRLYTRYARVLDVMKQKFDTTELAYTRAYGLVAEVCRGGVDNLNAMASQAGGVSSIDADFVRRRLQHAADKLPEAERNALQRRLQLIEDTEQELRELSARNEAAMTALDDTAVALAAVETERPQASVVADQALQDLRQFANRADRYNVSHTVSGESGSALHLGRPSGSGSGDSGSGHASTHETQDRSP